MYRRETETHCGSATWTKDREQGMVALDHYSEYKSVFVADA